MEGRASGIGEPMGLRWYKQVWADQSLGSKPASYRLAMLALAEFANDDSGQCWPSVETLSAMICLQERQTQRVLRSLHEDGYITIEIAHGRNRSNIYTIIGKGVVGDGKEPKKVHSSTLLDAEKVSPSTPFKKKKVSPTTEKVSPTTEKVSPTTEKGVLGDTLTNSEPIIEPSKEPSKTTTISSGNADEWKVVQAAYENNIGTFTQITSELAHDAMTTYGASSVVAAITEATRQNVRKWAYVDGILKRWQANGKKSAQPPKADRSRFVNGRELPPDGFRIINVYGQENL